MNAVLPADEPSDTVMREVIAALEYHANGGPETSVARCALYRLLGETRFSANAETPENSETARTSSAVINYMEMHGGGFVSRLAQAWRMADEDNRAKLMAAFGDIYQRYETTLNALRDGDSELPNGPKPPSE